MAAPFLTLFQIWQSHLLAATQLLPWHCSCNLLSDLKARNLPAVTVAYFADADFFSQVWRCLWMGFCLLKTQLCAPKFSSTPVVLPLVLPLMLFPTVKRKPLFLRASVSLFFLSKDFACPEPVAH